MAVGPCHVGWTKIGLLSGGQRQALTLLMATLKNAGIVVNTQGHANAALAKSADKINMYDIYRAVEGDKPLLHLDTDTNPDCGIGINIQFAIGDFYHEIQNMVNEKMKSITLQDIIDRYYFKIRKVKNL